MRVVIACSAFKGTLSATEACLALKEALSEALPQAVGLTCPIADGGDGTMQTIISAREGEIFTVPVTDPLQRPMRAAFGWLPERVAIIEIASASGLALLADDERDPLRATTWGTGELIKAALERGPEAIILGVGGSATNDGGAGIAQRMNVGLLDEDGSEIGPGALGLLDLNHIDLSRRDHRVTEVQVTVACDVNNPLLGEEGAARIFGPQKGAGTKEVALLERALENFSIVMERDLDISVANMPKGGAAGGAAAGLFSLLGADLRNGFDVVAESIGFDRLLDGADLVLVGEGSLDEQSLMGKAPIAAARRASSRGIPVWALAGRVELSEEVLVREGIHRYAALVDVDSKEALQNPRTTLSRVGSKMFGTIFR